MVKQYIHILKQTQGDINIMQNIFKVSKNQTYQTLNIVTLMKKKRKRNQAITNMNHPLDYFLTTLFFFHLWTKVEENDHKMECT